MTDKPIEDDLYALRQKLNELYEANLLLVQDNLRLRAENDIRSREVQELRSRLVDPLSPPPPENGEREE